MRLHLFATLSIFLSTSLYAQKISIDAKKMRLDSVLALLQRQSPYSFTYVSEVIRNARPVTVHIQNADLPEALTACLAGQDLSFRVTGNYIVIFPIADQQPDSREITGRITDEQGDPVAGAIVRVATGKMALTDEHGQWRLIVHANERDLSISSLGHADTAINIVGRNQFNIRLRFRESQLDETLVIAYDQTTRRWNTGNVSKVGKTAIADGVATNLLAVLSGRVPGLQITQLSGVPGSASGMMVRGGMPMDAELSGSDPLIIIDGIPFEQGNRPANLLVSAANNPRNISEGGISALNCLNLVDIESIEVLKDADATAIYGSRGANGVILVTTKHGSGGGPRLSVTSSAGIGWSSFRNTWMSTADYLRMRRAAFRLDGLQMTTQSAPDLLVWDTTRDQNFQRLLEGRCAFNSGVDISYEWGSDLSRLYANVSHQSKGTVFGHGMGEATSSARITLDRHDSSGRWQLQFSAYYCNDQNNLIRDDLTSYLSLPPHLALRDGSGEFKWNDGGYRFVNPLALLGKKYLYSGSFASVAVQGSYQLWKQLQVKLNAGYNYFGTDETQINPSSTFAGGNLQNVFSLFGTHRLQSWILEPQVNFHYSYRKHQWQLLAGASWQNKTERDAETRASGFTDERSLYYKDKATIQLSTSSASVYRYSAVFGKVGYRYANRYLLNFTGRADGSSRFGPSNKFAAFGAIGAAWVFTNERWLKNLYPVLSYGKLRASWGKTGNDQVGDYRYLSLWDNQNNLYNGSGAVAPVSLFNPDYNWERIRKMELGLELGFLRDRVYVDVSVFDHRSTGQPMLANLPTTTGFSTIILNYDAVVRNRGVEISVRSKNIEKPHFTWGTTATITFYHNRLLSFPGLAYSVYAKQYRVGDPVTERYALLADKPNPATGFYSFADINGDSQWNAADYVPVANLLPRLIAGFSNDWSFGSLSLHLLLEGRVQTGKSYLFSLHNYPGTISNQPVAVNNFWQEPGQSSDVPRPSTSAVAGGAGYIGASSLLYEGAGYIRVSQVGLNYSIARRIPQRCAKTLFLQAENLLLFTGYRVADPEANNFSQLPPVRQLKVGLHAVFL